MECDFLPTFEILLALIPAKTDLMIHMIGPSVSKTLPNENRHYNFYSKEKDSNLDITLSHSLYTEEFYSGSKLSSDFPSLKYGLGEPTAIIILNGLLLGYDSWISSVKLIIAKKAHVFCSEGMEQNAESVARNLKNLEHKLCNPIAANPFRQPIFQYKKDANLPAFSNGFVFGF